MIQISIYGGNCGKEISVKKENDYIPLDGNHGFYRGRNLNGLRKMKYGQQENEDYYFVNGLNTVGV